MRPKTQQAATAQRYAGVRRPVLFDSHGETADQSGHLVERLRLRLRPPKRGVVLLHNLGQPLQALVITDRELGVARCSFVCGV